MPLIARNSYEFFIERVAPAIGLIWYSNKLCFRILDPSFDFEKLRNRQDPLHLSKFVHRFISLLVSMKLITFLDHNMRESFLVSRTRTVCPVYRDSLKYEWYEKKNISDKLLFDIKKYKFNLNTNNKTYHTEK